LSRLTESQKMEIRHNIYEELVQDERISLTQISKNIGLARNTVTSHYNYMLDNEILFPPSLRLKMFADLREYVYFLQFEKPMRVHQELENYPHVVFHCLTSGAFDLVVFTDSPVDFDLHPSFKQCIAGGPRSNYMFTHVPRITYEKALEDIKTCIKEKSIEPGCLRTDLEPRTIIWNDLEWDLYYDLKYDMRRTFTEIVKKHGISKWLFYRSYDNIKENCIVTVPFYPQGSHNYSDFFILTKTVYEQVLVDIFLKIPCAGVTFKVEDYLVGWINVLQSYDVREFLAIFHWMEDQGIIETLMHAFPLYQSRKK
jgi:hypothetical protein